MATFDIAAAQKVLLVGWVSVWMLVTWLNRSRDTTRARMRLDPDNRASAREVDDDRVASGIQTCEHHEQALLKKEAKLNDREQAVAAREQSLLALLTEWRAAREDEAAVWSQLEAAYALLREREAVEREALREREAELRRQFEAEHDSLCRIYAHAELPAASVRLAAPRDDTSRPYPTWEDAFRCRASSHEVIGSLLPTESESELYVPFQAETRPPSSRDSRPLLPTVLADNAPVADDKVEVESPHMNGSAAASSDSASDTVPCSAHQQHVERESDD
ncbi:hypothetical protein AB1Y20_015604 [Prymnesium parvum]|uniref:Uncharacterized protein n=1 Tax=Prymnesium parvum TaxID=97485 RepID=A0AB34K1A3_PRYPA